MIFPKCYLAVERTRRATRRPAGPPKCRGEGGALASEHLADTAPCIRSCAWPKTNAWLAEHAQ